jgi:hypothetical protein
MKGGGLQPAAHEAPARFATEDQQMNDFKTQRGAQLSVNEIRDLAAELINGETIEFASKADIAELRRMIEAPRPSDCPLLAAIDDRTSRAAFALDDAEWEAFKRKGFELFDRLYESFDDMREADEVLDRLCDSLDDMSEAANWLLQRHAHGVFNMTEDEVRALQTIADNPNPFNDAHQERLIEMYRRSRSAAAGPPADQP